MAWEATSLADLAWRALPLHGSSHDRTLCKDAYTYTAPRQAYSYTHWSTARVYGMVESCSPNQRAISFLAVSTESEPWQMLRPTSMQ